MEKCGIRGTATAKLAFHDMTVPAENVLGPRRQGAEGRADGARLRPHDLRRELHRAGEVLPRRGRSATPRAAASSAGRSPSSSWSARSSRSSPPSPTRWRRRPIETAALIDRGARGLHARNGDPQGLLHRGPLAGRLRDASGPRRPGLLHRRALRAADARRPDQHRSARGPTRSCSRSSPWSACATSARASKPTLEGLKAPAGSLPTAFSFAGQHLNEPGEVADRPGRHADAAARRPGAGPPGVASSAGSSSAY